MDPPLRVLHLEDDVRDTELLQATLEAKGVPSELTRVETEHDFVAALKRGKLDLILADYTLPSFDGLSAMRLAQLHAPDVPFLFVSGTLGEDVAIEALKNGATDYVLKTHLARLGPSVTRALREARERTERKRAEKAVRRSEKELRDLIGTMPAMAFVMRADGSNEFVSRQWIEFSGLSAEQSAGAGWEITLHPDDVERHLAKWRAAQVSGQRFENEARHRDVHGNYRWLLVRAVPLRDEHGNIVKWYGAAIDVEDRKRAEEQVRRSEAYLAEAQRLTHTGSRALKPGMSKPLYWSEEMFRILGFDPEQGLPDNETVWQRVHPEDLKAFMQEQIDQVSSGNLKTEIANDYRVVLPDGAVKYIHGRSHPVFDEAGNVIEYVGTSVDVTDRKRAEEAVRRSEKELRDLIETIPAMAFVARPDGSNEFVSRKWIEFSGLSAEQSAGSGWEKTLHPDDLAEHLRKWREALASGQPTESEARHRDAHGNYRWLLVRAVPLRDEQENIRNWYGTAIDIEDRKRAEALLAGEKRILEMVAKGDSLSQILSCLCRLVEEQTSGVTASVLLLEGDRLRHGAAPSLPKVYTDAIDGAAIGPSSGSLGTAAYIGQQVIVEDIATDPLWADYRDAALPHGLRACWSTPIFSSRGKVIATFAMYYREPRSPTLRDQQIIAQITHLAGIAIERDRAEQALRASEQLARSHVEVMMRSLDVLATEAAPEKFTAEMLRTIGQRLQARSVLLWLRDPEDDSLHLRLMIDDGQQVPSHAEHPFVKDPHAWKRNLPFQEMLFTKGPVVCDDVEHDLRFGEELREYMMKRGRKRFLAIPMFVLGEVRGFIGIQHTEERAYRPEETELAQALAHHVMIATREAELGEQRRHAVLLEERTRMARDIHDTLAQGFTGVIIQLDTAVEALMDEEPEAAVEHIGRARGLARESLTEARSSVHALRPQALEKASFPDALKAIITNTTAGTSLQSDFQLKGEPRKLQSSVEENLLHIGQEALANALKHARATRFQARLSFASEVVRLELCDNGQGFVVDCVNGRGIGLIGMKERAQQIGATLEVTSKPGNGTTIVAVSAYPTAITT
jgi:PAS domain S-box-containing protein